MTYESDWWSIDIPDGYAARGNETCVDIVGESAPGVLQISAYRNDDRIVTDEDLLEFLADERSHVKLQNISTEDFSGFTTESVRSNSYWKEWCIRSGKTMIYATHNTTMESKNHELSAIERMVSSLRVHQSDASGH